MTYNKYLTDAIVASTIERVVVDGVTVYKVRRPHKGEEVVGYQPSDCFSEQTPTEQAEQKSEDNNTEERNEDDN